MGPLGVPWPVPAALPPATPPNQGPRTHARWEPHVGQTQLPHQTLTWPALQGRVRGSDTGACLEVQPLGLPSHYLSPDPHSSSGETEA